MKEKTVTKTIIDVFIVIPDPPGDRARAAIRPFEFNIHIRPRTVYSLPRRKVLLLLFLKSSIAFVLLSWLMSP